MSDFRSQEAGGTNTRAFTLVAKASGSPITTGTVNWYLKNISGANAGKWWRDSDQTWQVAETANAMTHQADGHWTRTLAASPWNSGDTSLEYAEESTNLHVPVSRMLKVEYTPVADSNRRIDLGDWLGSAPDALSSGKIPADVKLWLATAVAAATAGIPDVNVKNIVNVAAVLDANNLLEVDVVDWKGAAAAAMTGDAFARLGAPAGASTAADVAAVKTDTAAVKLKTDLIPAAGPPDAAHYTNARGDKLDDLDAAISTRMATFTLPTNFASLVIDGSGRVNAFLVGLLATVLTEGAGGQVEAAFKKFFDVAASTLTTADVNQTGDSFARLGAAGAGLTALGDARIAHLDADVSSRLATSGYTAPDNVGIASIESSIAALPTAAQVVSAMASHVAEGAYTWDDVFRLMLAAEGGKVDGGGSSTVHIRDTADTKNRVTALVDSNGNRTGVTLNLS